MRDTTAFDRWSRDADFRVGIPRPRRVTLPETAVLAGIAVLAGLAVGFAFGLGVELATWLLR